MGLRGWAAVLMESERQPLQWPSAPEVLLSSARFPLAPYPPSTEARNLLDAAIPEAP